MSTIAIAVGPEAPALHENVGVVEFASRWGAPIWPAEAPIDSPESPAVVPPSWMMVAIAFGQRPT